MKNRKSELLLCMILDNKALNYYHAIALIKLSIYKGY